MTSSRTQRPLSTAFGASARADGHSPAAVDWCVGDVLLDLYEVVALLGEGGMGKVHKVRHKGWNADLAVKSPRAEIFATAGGQESFVREAETWVNLGLHPHIVSCFYVRTIGDIPRIFAEYVGGGSLADWIRDQSLYEGEPEEALKRILDIAIQFAWGLHYAHEQGLVHQDVKPANLMLAPDGTAKVTDFGLAKARGLAGESAEARPGQSVLVSVGGLTPAYCSPEQARKQPVSRKTDLWSWAVSVLEMFTGEVLWTDGRSAPAALEDYLQAGPPRAGLPTLPQAIVDLMRECFAPTPTARPESLGLVASRLRVIHREETGEAHERQEPTHVDLTADSLNNRALSLLDLGRNEDALATWNRALTTDPDHLDSTYNRAVTLWRGGVWDDEEVVRALEAVRSRQDDDRGAGTLLGLVQLERGHHAAAISLLETAVADGQGDAAVAGALERARALGREGASVRAPEGYKVETYSVSLSADGRRALAVGNDGPSITEGRRHLRLWDVTTGDQLFQEEVGAKALRVHLGDPGEPIVCALYGGGWSVRYLGDGRVVKSADARDGGSCRIACVSPDGRWLLASPGTIRLGGDEGGDDEAPLPLYLVDLARDRRVQLGGHRYGAMSLAFSGDGRLGLSSGIDGAVLWDLVQGRSVFKLEGAIRSALCRGGKTVFAAALDDRKVLRRAQVWEATDGRLLRDFDTGHAHNIEWLSVSSDGSVGATAAGSSLKVWDLSSGRCLRTFSTLGDRTFRTVSLSGDGRWLLSGGAASALDGGPLRTVHLTRLPDPSLPACPPRLSRLWSVGETADSRANLTRLLQEVDRDIAAGHYPAALAALQTARALAGFERAPEVRAAWRRLSNHCPRVGLHGIRVLRTVEGHAGPVGAGFLSTDGRLLVSLGMGGEITLKGVQKGVRLENTLRLWDLEAGRCLGSFGEFASWDRIPRIEHDGEKPRLAQVLKDVLAAWHVGPPREPPFMARGPLDTWTDRRLVIVGNGLFEISTGRCLRTFAGPVQDVSLDGGYVLIREIEDGTPVARVRQLASGATVDTLPWPVDGAPRFRRDSDTNAPQAPLVQIEARKARGAVVTVAHAETGPQVQTFAPRDDTTMFGVGWAAISDDGGLAVWDDSTLMKAERRCRGSFCVAELEYELAAREPADWEEGARPYLEAFLTVHTPIAGDIPMNGKPSEEEIQRALSRTGTPSWSEPDFDGLIRRLQREHYGWLRPSGVRSELERMRVGWRGSRRPAVGR